MDTKDTRDEAQAQSGEAAALEETWDAAAFEQTWEAIGPQLAGRELDPTESMRWTAETVAEADAEPTAPVAVGRLPLLETDTGDEQGELVTTKVLGAGGMGKVELAIQRSLRREVAIKSTLGEGDGANARALLQEAWFTGQLEHPNIVPVHQLGRSRDDAPLLVMKRVEGVSWHDLIREDLAADGPGMADDRLARHIGILLAVCRAIEFAHSRGVLHRDIKPANVMVGAFGEVYLLDWGLAMALQPRSESRAVVGTPAQMAPEMLAGAARVSERTDVYLLGACLHAVLTGRSRHEGRNMAEVCASVGRSAPVDYAPEVPAELAELCNRATCADPARRPQSAADFRAALERYLEHRNSIALAAETHAVLAKLRPALAEEEPDSERIAALFAECRFGFAQALRGWPDNPTARAGLQESLSLVIERELARRNLGLAEALLAELPEPAPLLRARVAALRREQDEREARLRELEAGGDWRRGAGARVAFFLGLVAVVGGLWLWANGGHIRYRGSLTPERLAANVGLAVLVACAMVFVGRRQLMTSRVNRQLVLGVLVTGAAMFVQRLANIIEAPSTAALVSGEIVFAAYGAALGGLMLASWLWHVVPVLLAAAFLARLIPSYAGLCFALSALSVLAYGMWRLREGRLREGRAPESRPRDGGSQGRGWG